MRRSGPCDPKRLKGGREYMYGEEDWREADWKLDVVQEDADRQEYIWDEPESTEEPQVTRTINIGELLPPVDDKSSQFSLLETDDDWSVLSQISDDSWSVVSKD